MRPDAGLLVLFILATTLLLLAWLVPAPLLLPAFGAVAIAAAMLIAAVMRRFGFARGGDRITAWDAAGALAFIGFAAAMLSKPDTVVGFFSGAMTAL